MLRACKVAFIGVLLAIIPEETSVLWADDAKQEQAKPAQQNFTCSGKVVVVDREAGTVTVEVQKRLYLLKLSAESRTPFATTCFIQASISASVKPSRCRLWCNASSSAASSTASRLRAACQRSSSC